MKISDAIREWCDETDVDLNACVELRVLACRIDAEIVELPKDSNGVPINVGDTVYPSGGRTGEVTCIKFMDGATPFVYISGCRGVAYMPTKLTHICPDSLERIAGDIESAKGWCDQNGDYDTVFASISKSKLIEWSDRIRKLADKEGEHATN